MSVPEHGPLETEDWIVTGYDMAYVRIGDWAIAQPVPSSLMEGVERAKRVSLCFFLSGLLWGASNPDLARISLADIRALLEKSEGA